MIFCACVALKRKIWNIKEERITWIISPKNDLKKKKLEKTEKNKKWERRAQKKAFLGKETMWNPYTCCRARFVHSSRSFSPNIVFFFSVISFHFEFRHFRYCIGIFLFLFSSILLSFCMDKRIYERNEMEYECIYLCAMLGSRECTQCNRMIYACHNIMTSSKTIE